MTWQPIETAPKDGTPIWVVDGIGRQTSVRWLERYAGGFWALCVCSEFCDELEFYPHQWIPLPEWKNGEHHETENN